MTVREPIVEVDGEGGPITLFRERAGEAWKFRMGKNESAIYDMLSEEDLVGLGPAAKESRSLHSFREALTLLDRYPWFRLIPLEVHPEYLDEVIHAVAERGGMLTAARWLLKFAGSVAVLTGAGVSARD